MQCRKEKMHFFTHPVLVEIVCTVVVEPKAELIKHDFISQTISSQKKVGT
jgi:hypothetical protein